VLAGIALLQQTEPLSPRARNRLEVVRRNAELEARLIDDLLDFTGTGDRQVETRPAPGRHPHRMVDPAPGPVAVAPAPGREPGPQAIGWFNRPVRNAQFPLT
jgi:hypothetical protein